MKYSMLLALTISSLSLAACTASDMQTLTTGGSASKSSIGQFQQVNPSVVHLYYNNDHPKHYKTLGRVSASNDNMVGIPHSQQAIEEKLKSEAASIGANAVIHINQGLEDTTGDAVLAK